MHCPHFSIIVKKYFSLRRFKDVEKAISYLFTLSDDEDATGIDVALEPPVEGVDSDCDDIENDTAIVDEDIHICLDVECCQCQHI